MNAMTDLKGKRLGVIGGRNIKKETDACAEKYGLSVSYLGSRKIPGGHFLFYALNTLWPKATRLLLKARRMDAVLLITAEKVIKRNIRWLEHSEYPFYATEEQWNILMNKRSFGEYAARFGLPPIPSVRIDPSGETAEVTEYPVVVKETESSGSSGVSICRDEQELKEALNAAFRNAAGKEVVCQKYLSGPYFQFEVWMQDGRAYFPYIKDRVFYSPVGNCPPQPFIDLYPSENGELVSSCLFAGIEKMMASLHMENGSCMFQGIIDHGTPYIMDTAFRVSGGLDFKVVQKETGADLIEAHILYALGKPFGGDFNGLGQPYRHAYAVLCPGLKNGVIGRIKGLEEIREMPFVFECFQYYHKGQKVTESGRFAQTGFRIFLVDESREKLLADVKEVLRVLQVEDEAGRSMLLDHPEF